MSESSYAALVGLAKVGASPAYANMDWSKTHFNIHIAIQTWARLTWRDRFDAWLQDDSHVPNSLTWPDVIEYRVGKFSVTPRTLSQSGSDKTPAFCTVPAIDVEFERYRRECIKNAIEYLSKL